jgi:hypothetical protein
MYDVASSFERSATYGIKWCYIPEDQTLHRYRWENLKSSLPFVNRCFISLLLSERKKQYTGKATNRRLRN